METKNYYTQEEMEDMLFGAIGTPLRDEYEQETQKFIIGEMIKEQRQKAHMTQEQLAEKIGSKKSYISRIESGKNKLNISTLHRIVEQGFGKKLQVKII